MTTTILNQRTIANFQVDAYLPTWIEAFLLDRKVQNLSQGTIGFYQDKLKCFSQYCEAQGVKEVTQIDAGLLRNYLLFLEANGHNAGGIHAAYRTVKTFLRWWGNEVEPEGWKNPITKVKAPKVGIEPLEPVDIQVVTAMMDACPKGTFLGDRDRAMMLFLLDTGVRASELVAVQLEEINPITGEVIIRRGEGKKAAQRVPGRKIKESNPRVSKASEGIPLACCGSRMMANHLLTGE